MDFLFGDGSYGLRFLFAFIVVLGLIGLTAWLVRRFGGGRLGAATTRGRQPRLAVIDAAQVDGRRRLILIRRDNVEHLLMIGGPSDVVIEPNIVRAAAARDAAARSPAATDTLPRAMPLGEGAWPLQPEPMPAPPPPAPRPHRAPPPQPPVVEETMQWQVEPEAPPPPAPPPRQNRAAVDPLAGLAAELSRNPPPQSDPAIPPPRPVRERPPAREREAAREQEPPREAPPQQPRVAARAQLQQPAQPVEAPFASAADQNLAEMAQRLEAALRRPGAKAAAEPRPAEPKAIPAPQPEPPPPQVEAVHEEPEPPAPVAAEPRIEPKVAEPRPAPSEPKPVRDTRSAQGKSPYDSLEQEMASLLGRPNSKS
jgi:hypothetical protein